jgi:acetaldehyde dehydrogenase/alcohol dehydrogenase
MWLFYEQPEADFVAMSQKFADIRKRVYKFPILGKKSQMVAIPTTSGTGSEVTSFAVISDKSQNMKYPLADYELTPDVAIIDPDLVMSVPPTPTADTGLDVLTHAIEAYVSVLASDYTDALAIKAIQLVFEYLPRSYKFGAKDPVAREKMHNASTIAGMAFTNAFLGINHSLAHKLGGEFHLVHGRANAILLPHVIEYNGTSNPSKFAIFPKYERYVAHEKYAEIARILGLPASTTEEGVKSLANAVRNLMKELNIPLTIKEMGIDEKLYNDAIEDLAYKAFDDQCTTANPRLPKVTELVDLYKKAYYGI